MSAFKTLSILSLSLLFITCEKEDTSTDFTEEHLFTTGIEGPAVDAAKNLYAVNFEKEGTIGIVDAQGKASLFMNLPNGSIGNGIRFDKEGNMFIADYKSATGKLDVISEIIVKGYDELEKLENISVGNISKDIVKIIPF